MTPGGVLKYKITSKYKDKMILYFGTNVEKPLRYMYTQLQGAKGDILL